MQKIISDSRLTHQVSLSKEKPQENLYKSGIEAFPGERAFLPGLYFTKK
jgi:hypothetical protein